LVSRLILFCLSGLASCADASSIKPSPDSNAIKLGPDSYTISTRVHSGGSAGAKGEALKEAAAFCESQNREVLPDYVDSSACALHVRGGCSAAEIYFHCLAPDDPQLKRSPRQADFPS
jgi:hypothetical protein